MESINITPPSEEPQTQGLLIGLCGYSCSGKDSLADVLVEHCNYVKLGFSDALWNLALTINPRLRIGWARHSRLQKIADRYGYTRAKEFPAVRRYLQWLGTEAVRHCLGEDAWIHALMPRVEAILNKGRNVVITNVRFVNEAEAVQELGGYVIRVDRSGKGPVNGHSSDAGLAFPLAFLVVENFGSLDALAQQAFFLHQHLCSVEAQQQAQSSILRLYTGDEYIETINQE